MIRDEDVILDPEVIRDEDVIVDREPIYYMSRNDKDRVRNSFNGDPLNFIASEGERDYVRGITEQMTDRDMYRKKMALAAYFTMENPGSNFNSNLENMDVILEKFYKKKMTIDAAYTDLGKVLNPGEGDGEGTSVMGEHLDALAAGLIAFSAKAGSAYAKLAKWGLQLWRPLIWSDRQKVGYDAVVKVADVYGKEIRKQGQEITSELDKESGANPNFIADLVTGDFENVSVTDFTKALVRSSPDMAFQILLAAAGAGPLLLPSTIGVTTVTDKSYEVEEKQPGWSAAKKAAYIGLSAVNEALFEYATGRIVKGGMSKEMGAKIISQGLWKYIGKSFGKEGGTEGLQQLNSNVLDLLFDLEGDADRLSRSEKFARVMNGVGESTFIGGVWGVPEGFAGYYSSRDVIQSSLIIKKKHRQTLDELIQKENLTAEESKKLENSKRIVDTDDARQAVMLDFAQRQIDAYNELEEILESEEYKIFLEETADTAYEEDVIDAVRAERNYTMGRAAEWNIEDTVNTAAELAAQFPAVNLHIVRSAEEFTPEAKKKIEEEGFDANLIRAWIDGDDVYLAAQNVRPSDVARTLGHEIIGHKGLRGVFGDKFDMFLDGVYRDHAEEIIKTAERYHRGTETVEDQRYATEEFLADCADAKVKPSWWKEFLGWIRAQLRKIMPRLHFTDADIEAALSRSGRLVRKGNPSSPEGYAAASESDVSDKSDISDVASESDLRFTLDENQSVKKANVVLVSNLPVDANNTELVRNYLFEHFYGREVQIQSDGRWTYFNRNGLKATLKRRGEHRNSFSNLDKIIEDSYPTGYEYVDQEHKKKRPDLKGQFIYATLLDIEGELYVATLKLDDTSSDSRAIFKDISIKKRSLYAGQPQEVGDLPADRMITIQQLIDFVKSDFSDTALFSEKIPVNSGQSLRFSISQDNDAAYLDAVNRGDMETAQKMVDDAAKGAGYIDDVSWRMDHRAPNRQTAEKITNWRKIVPDDYFDHPEYYIDMSNPVERESFYNVKRMLDFYEQKKAKGNGSERYVSVRMYRAVDNTVNKREDNFRNGDWVTPSRKYAENEGEMNPDGYRIIMKSARLEDLYWDGNSICEFGYDDGQKYGYADTKNNRKLLDAVTYDDDGNIIPLSKRFNKREFDVRFSLAEYSEEDQRDIVAILKPFTGSYIQKDKEDYQAYLKKHGVDIPLKDAWSFALEAAHQARSDSIKRAHQRRDAWLYENIPLYREAVDFAGEDFIIKPSERFRTEAFTGSWISPEYRKYSELKPQGKKESDKQYQKRRQHAEKKLKEAKGMWSDELAGAIARRWGRDSLDVEQELIDFFRDLKKPDLYKYYTDWKNQELYGVKELERAAKEEFLKNEQAEVEDTVVDILSKGQPVTEEYLTENKKVYKELYKQVFQKEAPSQIGKGDLEALNAALTQEGRDASGYAAAYKDARKKSYEEFQERLRAFRDKIMKKWDDALALQREAIDFSEQNLPAENRGEFVRGIVNLLNYPTSPSGKYPEGRRMAEFRNLIAKMTDRSAETRKSRYTEEIKEMLSAVRIKRNYKGIPVSVLPSEQSKVERIRKIVDMNLAAVSNAISYNNEKLLELENANADEEALISLQQDNELLQMFGNLEHKSADQVEAARKFLDDLIKGGKAQFREKLQERKAEVDRMRAEAIGDITSGSYEVKKEIKKRFGEGLLRNSNLMTLMRLTSGKAIENFDDSVFGKLYKDVEDSTQAEATALRRMQDDLDDALEKYANIKGNFVQKLKAKGAFFKMLGEKHKDSGVFITQYTGRSKIGQELVFEEGRRDKNQRSIPIEDYEQNGVMRPGARTLLKEIDNGNKVTQWQGIPLDAVSVAFLRQQLADFDAGLKQSYQIFGDEKDDAAFQRIIEEEQQGGRLVLFGHHEDEISTPVELELSQGSALQILLTWEQENYKPNMLWNGWTESSIEQLKKFIKPEVMAMGRWMRDYIKSNSAKLDAKVMERYGAHLPETENYFPGKFENHAANKVTGDGSLGRGAGSMSINPNFLIARKFHLLPVDLEADAFSVFMNNQLSQVHFLSWTDSIKDLQAVYNSSKVQKAIDGEYGGNVYQNLTDRIKVLAAGGVSSDHTSAFFNRLYRNWVPAKIGLNSSSVIKQLAGVTSYMNNVPIADFLNGYRESFNPFNNDYKEFVRWAKNSDYMKNRLAGGMDRDLDYLLNYTKDSAPYSPLTAALLQVGTIGTRWADQVSTLHGGYAVYRYALKQAEAAGMSHPEAVKAAQRAWMRSTDETQQSGYLKDQNYYQSNAGATRFLTSFLSNPIQTMNLEIQAIQEYHFGGKTKAARDKMLRRIFVNHFVVPTLMMFTTDMIRHGFDVSDWLEEAEFEDYMLAWLLGSYESLFLTGKLVTTLGNFALDRILDRRTKFGNNLSAIPLADDVERAIVAYDRILDSDELTEKEVMDGIKATGDVMMLGSALNPASSAAGQIGAVVSAIGSQGKRLVKWFSEDEK